jgi:hypothetical protein
VDQAGRGGAICVFVRLQDVVVDIAQEGCVEPVGHLRETDVEAYLDHLLDGEVLSQSSVGSVIDVQRLGGSLRVANDRRFGIAVHPIGQGVISQVPQLFLADPDAPTEHHVMRDSVVAIVGDGRRRTGEFGEGWRQAVVMAHGPHELD